MSCTIPFAGTSLELHGAGVAWFPEYKILCASDIHFEKGSFFQRFSTLLPPYDTLLTLQRLSEVVAHFTPQLFISLGDAFHDKAALERIHPADRAQLTQIIGRVPRWIWVEGNHDQHLQGSIGGERHSEFETQGIVFRHIAEPDKTDWELSGHYHPKAHISLRGHAMRLPCFIASGTKVLLPAFGSYTGGLDVTAEAISAVWPPEARELFLLHKNKIFPWRE